MRAISQQFAPLIESALNARREIDVSKMESTRGDDRPSLIQVVVSVARILFPIARSLAQDDVGVSPIPTLFYGTSGARRLRSSRRFSMQDFPHIF